MAYEVNGREIISEVLLKLKEDVFPHLPVACKTCPMAMWQVHGEGKEIKAYCRVMHVYTWQTSKPTEILDCDALYQTEEEPFMSLISQSSQNGGIQSDSTWPDQSMKNDYESGNYR